MYCTLILIVCLFVVVLLAAVALAAALADLRLELVLLVAAQVRVRHVVQRVRVAAGLLVMNITLFQGSQIKVFRKQTARSGFKSTRVPISQKALCQKVSHLGGHEVQLELGLLLQGEPLDGEQRVGLGLADDDPPALLALRGEVGRDDRACSL